MAIFKAVPHPSQDPASSLRVPASKRISLTASQRLSTITEGSRDMAVPTVPLRSILRTSNRAPGAAPMSQHPAYRSQETLGSGPPAYGVHGSSIAESEDLTAPVEGEKLAELRRAGPQRKSRGGWKRLLIILAVVLVIIGLAVGLGVGLTVGRRLNGGSDSSSAPSSTGSTTPSKPQFPLGERSFVTALRQVQTNCTARAATWRCYPDVTFDTNNASSMAVFNWVISNNSAQFADQSIGSTSSAGISANLSISTTNNPFASISFTNQSLTYFSDAGNASSARYSFNFTMSRSIVPNPPITSNGQSTRCFFNSTVVTGNIFLNLSRSYPDAASRNSGTIGGYDQWPYAVELSQVSPGGSAVPDCYELINGVVADRIVNGLTPQPASSQCVCDYRNF